MTNTPKPQANKTIKSILTEYRIGFVVSDKDVDQHFKEFEQSITQAMLDAVGEDIELRADIDDELRRFVPDIDERSLEVSGVPSSFTNLYTRAIVRSTQRQIRTAIKKIGGSDD